MTHAALKEPQTTGPVGPVAVLGVILLLAAGPLLRGGFRSGPVLILEIIALFVLGAMVTRSALLRTGSMDGSMDTRLWPLVLSPLAIALIQLTPLPGALWQALPGFAPFAETAREMGIEGAAWIPLSLSPDLTRASLLAGIPLVVAFAAGHMCTLRQLRIVVRAVVGLAFVEVLWGLLQLSGGQHSPFYMGMMTYGSPIGSLPTRNLYANFLALVLAAYIWLAYDTVRYNMRLQKGSPLRSGVFDARHALVLWVMGGLLLVLGILMSRSRAGALFGLGAAVIGLGMAGLRVFGWSRGWRFALPITALLLGGAGYMMGFDNVVNRVSGDQLASATNFRGLLARSSFEGAWAYLPFGSGWGTYELAYPRFQPASVAFTVDYAHMDYAQLFMEGGILFLALAGYAAWLLVGRARFLARASWRCRTLSREAMAAALCGVGLMAFLLHAAVDFPMRIPGNAVLAAFLAGVFLRALPEKTSPASTAIADTQFHESELTRA